MPIPRNALTVLVHPAEIPVRHGGSLGVRGGLIVVDGLLVAFRLIDRGVPLVLDDQLPPFGLYGLGRRTVVIADHDHRVDIVLTGTSDPHDQLLLPLLLRCQVFDPGDMPGVRLLPGS